MTGVRRERTLLHVVTVPITLHFLEGQPRYMKSRGFTTHVLCSPGADLGAFLGKEPGVTAHTVPMRRNPSPLKDLVALVRMIREVRRIRPDVVHTHTPKGGMLGVLSARITGVPLVVHHIHGGVWLAATGLRRLMALATDRMTCALAHRVFCVSHSVRNELVRRGLCPAWKVEVLGEGSINGIDADGRFNPDRIPAAERSMVRARYRIPNDAVVIGFVGRLTREKGIIELIEAWQDLRARHPKAHMLLVGPNDDETPLPIETLTRLQQDDRIHLTGMEWNTPPLFRAMDLFVLPTYREGFPVVLLEAEAMRLPVVASAVPGCTDAVRDGITGALVPARDVPALRSALDRYLSSAVERVAHGQAGRDRVLESFQREDIWALLAAAYDRGAARDA